MADEVPEDDRTIELSSIAAIFPELVVDPSDPYHATLELPVTPLKPLRIRFEQPIADSAPPLPTPPTRVESGDRNNPPSRTQDDGKQVHDLEHLPSLKLDINLHDNYPIDDPPRVFLLVDQPWLPRKKLKELEADCVRLWEELGRDQVVYSYIDHLQQQAEDAFGFTSDDKGFLLPAELKLTLLDFDLRAKRQQFERETFGCGICLEPKKGKDCHRIQLCGHVFCNACLTDFFTSCITEGDVDNVKCMDPTCGKEASVELSRKKRRQDRTLNPSELLQIPLSQDMVQRYIRLKRKKKLESSKGTIYCPRQWCQGPAYPEYRKQKSLDDFDDFSEPEDETPAYKAPSSHSELLSVPMSQRLAICSDCSYAFCLVCQKTWHGSHSTAAQHCNPRNPQEMAAEEQASIDYVKRHSTPCPTCAAPAQKTMGCNHMICFKCNTHFCYLCSSYLMSDNPYKHFNDQKSPCYMRLWELEGGDGEGAENHWAGVGGEGVAWDEDLTSDDDEENVPQPHPPPLEPPAVPPVVVQDEENDTSDEEPAPDIRRRERAIEFVNFANPGRGGRRINIPDRERPENVVPPAVPDPPRNIRQDRGQQPNRLRRQQNEPPHNHRPQPRPDVPDAAQEAHVAVVENGPENRPWELEAAHEQIRPDEAEDRPVDAEGADDGPPPPFPRAAPGQNNNDTANPAPARAMGLERFLELARLDAEDEWDSDELDEDDDGEWDFEQGGGGAAAGANAAVREGRNRGGGAGVEGRMVRREGRNHWNRRGL